MKLLVLNVQGLAPDLLLADERLNYVRHLLDAGAFGRLDQPGEALAALSACRDVLERLGKPVVLVSSPEFDAFRQMLESQSWDFAQFDVSAPENLEAFDAEIGRVLELLSEDTAVLIVALPGKEGGSAGAFVLVAATVTLSGEVEGATGADLLPTLLELAGLDRPSDLSGRSLVSGHLATGSGSTLDEEQIIRERLKGLGYLA